MCGIAGFIAGQGFPETPDALRGCLSAMTGRLAHRGPDGSGLWLEGPVGLGHRRLSIIDLEAGAQPMLDAQNRAVVSFNGEIYNYRELRQELETLGHAFRTCSDTETILAAYLQWGEACLDRLDGMFAFALWDRRECRLLLARDRYGKKPLFYTFQRGGMAFASELSALRALPFLNFTTTRETLARFLVYESCPAPRSICREALKLPPAHSLLLSGPQLAGGGAPPEPRAYWSLPLPEYRAAAPEQELAERLVELLDAAVKKRLVSDVPLGVFLSGGLDSTLVAALMARHGKVKSFSIGFTEASYDESRFARLAARHIGAEHHERVLSAAGCGGLLPGIVEGFDEPMADPSIVPTHLLAALTREHVIVALGGDGGDELFAGYETFYAFRLAQWLDRLPQGIRTGLLAPIAGLLPQSSGYVNPRLAAQAFLSGAAAPPWQRARRWLTPFAPGLLAQVMELPPWLRKDEALLAPSRAAWEARPAPGGLDRMAGACAREYLHDYILVKVDRCTMLNSLEARAPFLDRHVAEFVWRLPMNVKLRGLSGKHLLRRAARGIVPDEILRRPKRGFLIPVADWLRGVLRPVLEDLLSEDALRAQGLFHPKAVGALVREHLGGQADHRRPLWTLLVLQLWLRRHAPEVV